MDNFVSATRVGPLLRKGIEEAHYYGTFTGKGGGPTGGLSNVSFHTGLSTRTLHEIAQDKREYVGVSTLDKLLTGLNLEYLSYYTEEEGGFKDVYDAMRAPRDPIYDRRYKEKRGPRVKVACPSCDGPMDARSELCAPCRYTAKASKVLLCSECSKRITKKSKSGKCRACYNRGKGAKAHRGEYRKGIRRRLGQRITDA